MDQNEQQQVQHVDNSLVVRFLVGPAQKEIEANKIMLEGYSPMLKAKYSGIWSSIESGDKSQVIILPDVDPKAFRMFLRVLSVNPLDQDFLTNLECTVDIALHLFNLSKMYMVQHIQEGCRDFLLAALRQDPCSIVLIYEALKNTDEENLKEEAYSELQQNFGLVILNDAALAELSNATWMEILLQSATDDNARIYPLENVDEKEILKALARWGMLKSDLDGNLVEHIIKILPHVALHKIPDTELHDILFFIPEEDVHQIKQQQLEEISAREERARQEEQEKLWGDIAKWKLSVLKFICEIYKTNRQQRVTSGLVDAQTVTGESDRTKMKIIVGDTETKLWGTSNVVQNFLPHLNSGIDGISVHPESENEYENVENKKVLVIDLPDINQNLLEKLQKVLAVDDLTWNYFSMQNFTKIEVLDILFLSRIYFRENVAVVCIEFFKNSCDVVNDSAFFVYLYESLKSIQPNEVGWAYQLIKSNFVSFFSHDAVLGEMSAATWCKVLQDTTLDSSHRTGQLNEVREVDICRGLLRWGEIQCRKQALEPSTKNVLNLVRRITPFVLFNRIPRADLMGLEEPLKRFVEAAKQSR